MDKKVDKKELIPDKERRSFIKKVLKGSIAGSLLLVYPIKDGDTKEVPEQIPGIRGHEYDMSKQNFVFIRHYKMYRLRLLLCC